MRNILRIVICIACMLYSASSVYSVPAYPGLIDFKQPDGQTVKIYVHGDEFLHWASTEDGYTLLYDAEGYLAYAEKDAIGNLVPSRIRPTSGTDSRRKAPERSFLQGIEKGLWFSDEQVNMARQAVEQFNQSIRKSPAKAKEREPLVGKRHFVTILVEYQDVHFKYTKEDFEKLFNQLNYHENGAYGSVRDFYLENSFGKLDITTDVYGVYRLSRNMKEYGHNTGNSFLLAPEAIHLADADIDFSKYDNDGDGIVEGVHVIFAGDGAEGGNGSNVWSHASTIRLYCDGVLLNRYCCTPERLRGTRNNIGVICHELGHVLGALDYYDTDYASGGKYNGTGTWDVMASGSWNGPHNNGACPPHFNPDVKVNIFRWADAMDGNHPTSFKLKAKDENSFVRIDTKTEGEYFLLEYRSQTGFDQSLPGHGLMIYRASSFLSVLNDRWANSINTTHPQGFYPLNAAAIRELPTEDGGYGQISSPNTPFPGTGNIFEISDFGTPSMKSWNGVPTEKPITSIKENVEEEYVTFDVAGGGEGVAYAFKVTDADETSVTLSWKTQDSKTVMLVHNSDAKFGIPDVKGYDVGEVINGGGKVLYVGTELEYKHTGLTEMTKQYYRLYTKKTDGSWTLSGETFCRTAVGVIRKFPYFEDFETQCFGEEWKQEQILPYSGSWKVNSLKEIKYETDKTTGATVKNEITHWKACPEYDFSSPYQMTRLIMPPIDFTGVKSAALSFKYINAMGEVTVQYRTSPSDNWHNLYELDINGYQYGHFDFHISHEKSITINLPNLTSTYEIAFLPHFIGSGSSLSIDDIMIETEDFMYAKTLDAQKVGEGIADFTFEAFTGSNNEYKQGIQWIGAKGSKDVFFSPSETKRISFKDEECFTSYSRLVYLVYYKAFVENSKGERIYGEQKTLYTKYKFDGDGTKENPYKIYDVTDYVKLYNIRSILGATEKLYFSIEGDFDISNTNSNYSILNCEIDGKGHTLTAKIPPFEKVGENAVIKNLNLVFTDDIGICRENLGAIYNCNIKSGAFVNSDLKYNRGGGICRMNSGIISGCHTEFDASYDGISFGGICLENSGIVNDCSYRGQITGSNQSLIGGIVANNGGIISNCINYGKIELKEEAEQWTAMSGGICGKNSGHIERCVNQGAIRIENGNKEICSGGIAGHVINNGTKLKDCVNFGDINIINSANEGEVPIGGIAGKANCRFTQNLVNYGNIYIDDKASTNSIFGINYNFDCTNAYYDYNAGCNIDSPELVLNVLNENQNHVWNLDENGKLCLDFVKTQLSPCLGELSDFGSNYFEVQWVASGENMGYCVLEWRKLGEKQWQSVSTAETFSFNEKIESLLPKTQYEVRLKTVSKDGYCTYSDISKFSTYFATSGKEGNDHEICNAEEFRAFADMIEQGNMIADPNTTNKDAPQKRVMCKFGDYQKVVLKTDIDLEGRNGKLWEPIGNPIFYFDGEFDGNGHIIYDMKIHTSKMYVGLFAHLTGYVHDLTLKDADICVSHSFNDGEYAGIPGVGGIVGYCGFYSGLYEHLVERCGYEGSISVSNTKRLGGILGCGTQTSSKESTIKDCYVNADIICCYSNDYANSPIGGIVGEGCALDCYFTGNIDVPDKVKTVGPIRGKGLQNGLKCENCFYNAESDLFTVSEGNTYKSSEEMKTLEFLTNLTDGVWTFGSQLNDGFPVFVNSANTNVNTQEAMHDAVGDVVLKGLYRTGVTGNHNILGFEYFNNSTEQLVVKTVNAINDKNMFTATIPNAEAPRTGVEYRAFATNAEKDTLFGEWVRFYPSIIKPKALLWEVKCKGTALEFDYAIDPGTENIVLARIVTKPYKDNAVEIHDIDIDDNLLRQHFNGKAGEKFVSYIEAETSNGIVVRSDEVAWTAGEALTGDANADFRLTVADVTTTVNYILDMEPTVFNFDNADANKDKNITVTDATIIINLVMATSYSTSAPTTGDDVMAAPSNISLHMNDVTLDGDEAATMTVTISQAPMFVATQFDVTVPNGVEIVEAKANGNHTALLRQMADGSYRIMIYSMGNDSFAQDDVVALTFYGEGHGEVKFSNIFVNNIDGTDIHESMLAPAAARYINTATAIDDVKGQQSPLYNLQGIRVNDKYKGIVIENGKKKQMK